MKNNLFLLLALIYAFFLPGYLITKAGLKKHFLLSTLAVSLGISIALIPIAAFGIALLLRTTVQKNLILAIVTLINIACIIIVLAKRNKKI